MNAVLQRIFYMACACLLTFPSQAYADRTTTYTYYDNGLLHTIDGPRSDVVDTVTHTYDAQGNRATTVNALGHITQFTQYDGAGRLLRMVDANGLVTTYSFHPRGWLLSQTEDEGADARLTSYDYDLAGDLIKLTLPTGGFISYAYDNASRLDMITDSDGNKITYQLNPLGKRTQETIHDPAGTLRRVHTRDYNQLNRLEKDLDAELNPIQYDYDPNGNLIKRTDALTRSASLEYDALDRLKKQIDPALGETDYQYDARDNQTSVTGPNGNTTTYNYNGFDEKIQQNSPDTGITSYGYDDGGNLISQTDARNIQVTHQYDALNRRISSTYPNAELNVIYTYDQGSKGLGRLTQVDDAVGTRQYSYNPQGQVITDSYTADGVESVVDYTYGPLREITHITYPSGGRAHYTRDDLGKVIRLSWEDVSGRTIVLADNLGYAPFGPMESLQFGNGLQLQRQYDLDYQITGQSLGGILNDNYQYDVVGNIKNWSDALVTSNDQNFTYDLLDRVDTAAGPWGDLDYDYDPVGNRTQLDDSVQTLLYSYALDRNQLESIPSQARQYAYDAMGNTLSDGQRTFTYDDVGRLKDVDNGDTVTSYRYNAQGERVVKITDTQSTHFRYDLEGHLLGEYRVDGSVIREYVFLNNELLAQVSPEQSDNGLWQLGGSYKINYIAQENDATDALLIDTANAKIWVREPNKPVFHFDLTDTGSRWFEYADYQGNPRYYFSWNATDENTSGPTAVSGSITLKGDSGTGYLFIYEPPPSQLIFKATQNPDGSFDDSWQVAENTAHWTIDLSTHEVELQLTNSELLRFTPDPENWVVMSSWSVDGASTTHGFSYEHDGLVYVGKVIVGATSISSVLTITPEDSEARTAYFNLNHAVNASSDKIAYYHNDHLGTPRKLTSQQGEVVWESVRLPFGETMVLSSMVENPVRSPGQYYDGETGLHYNYFRDYDPSTGRYIQSDPIGLAGGLNTYAYVGGNPVNYTDPLGLARFAFRPLDGDGPYYNSNPVPSGVSNHHRAHEQLWFDDNRNENIGFFAGDGSGLGPQLCGEDGEVRPDVNHTRNEYDFFGPVYDDDIMRRALNNVRNNWNGNTYCLAGRNCQHFANRLRREYRNLTNPPKCRITRRGLRCS